MNVYNEKPIVHKQIVQNEKIKKIELIQTDIIKNLLIHTDFGIRVFKIKRGAKQADASGHQGPILKIICLEPSEFEK
jgi:hypothetical protein